MMVVNRPFAAHHGRERAGRMDVEDDDRQSVLARHADRRRIHDGEVAGENVVVGQLVVAIGIRGFARIGGVDAIDLGALEQRVAVHLRRPQRGRGIGGEERVSGAGREDHDPALLHVTLGPTADIGLADRAHRDRRLHTGLHAVPLHDALQSERVHHGGEHAHVVGRGAIHSGCGARDTPEDVPAAHDETDLDTSGDDVGDIGRDPGQDLTIETVFLLSHERFAGNLQQDALVGRLDRHEFLRV